MKSVLLRKKHANSPAKISQISISTVKVHARKSKIVNVMLTDISRKPKPETTIVITVTANVTPHKVGTL